MMNAFVEILKRELVAEGYVLKKRTDVSATFITASKNISWGITYTAYINAAHNTVNDVINSVDLSYNYFKMPEDYVVSENNQKFHRDIQAIILKAYDKSLKKKSFDINIEGKEVKTSGKGDLKFTLKGFSLKRTSTDKVEASKESRFVNADVHIGEIELGLNGSGAIKGALAIGAALKDSKCGTFKLGTTENPFSGNSNVKSDILCKDVKVKSTWDNSGSVDHRVPGDHKGQTEMEIEEISMNGTLEEIGEGIMSIIAQINNAE